MSLAMNEFIVSTLTLKTIFFFIKKCFAGLKKKKLSSILQRRRKRLRRYFSGFPHMNDNI